MKYHLLRLVSFSLSRIYLQIYPGELDSILHTSLVGGTNPLGGVIPASRHALGWEFEQIQIRCKTGMEYRSWDCVDRQGGSALCSGTTQFPLTMSLSIQKYNGNQLIDRGTLQNAGGITCEGEAPHIDPGKVSMLLVASCYKNRSYEPFR